METVKDSILERRQELMPKRGSCKGGMDNRFKDVMDSIGDADVQEFMTSMMYSQIVSIRRKVDREEFLLGFIKDMIECVSERIDFHRFMTSVIQEVGKSIHGEMDAEDESTPVRAMDELEDGPGNAMSMGVMLLSPVEEGDFVKFRDEWFEMVAGGSVADDIKSLIKRNNSPWIRVTRTYSGKFYIAHNEGHPASYHGWLFDSRYMELKKTKKNSVMDVM